LYVIVVALWGTTWIAMRAAVATVPAITASGLRFAIAFPLLALVVARRPGVPLRYPRGHGRLLVLVTLGYFTVPFVLMNLGSAAVPSGLAAVLFATVAVFIVVLSVPVLHTRIGRRQAAGAAVALTALVALVARQTGLGGSADPLGALALLAAAGLHATVYVVLKRDAGAISPLTLNTLPMGLAAGLLCGAGLAFEHPRLGAISSQSLAALLYLGAFASVAGFLAYFELLRRLGPIPLALVFVLFPVVAQVAATLTGERPMGAASLALLALVLGASLSALTGGPRVPGRGKPAGSVVRRPGAGRPVAAAGYPTR
jgi:drug/metabolite transporter (DMT)-like permease